MNVLTIFDQRISTIIMEGAPGSRAPFSFKRLARRAVREMEDETFVIDGVDTAPALYTILLSAGDDEFLRPMYVQITEEISQLVEAQAKKRGYTFVGKPLVRFMVDPALRNRRFSVFAENIDPRTLARLRDEENAYLGITSPREIHDEREFVPEYVPVATSEPAYVSEEASYVPEPVFEDEPVFSSDSEPVRDEDAPEISAEFQQTDYADEVEIDEAIDASADKFDEPQPEEPAAGHAFWGRSSAPKSEPKSEPKPEAEVESEQAEAFEPAPAREYAPEPAFEPKPEPEPEPAREYAPEPAFEPKPEPEPVREYAPEPVRSTPHVVPHSYAAAQTSRPTATPAPAPASSPTCRLIDLGSGATYTISTTHSVIGRERTPGGVVLRDPNVSRRHAEISFTNTGWRIFDLGSTNGTLVNDVDVREAQLHNGDVLTIGLVNLEFRAG